MIGHSRSTIFSPVFRFPSERFEIGSHLKGSLQSHKANAPKQKPCSLISNTFHDRSLQKYDLFPRVPFSFRRIEIGSRLKGSLQSLKTNSTRQKAMFLDIQHGL